MENNVAKQAQATPRKKKSQFVEVWKRFKKNPLAMVGLAIIISLFIFAALADVLAPGDGVHPGFNLQDWFRIRHFPSAENIFGTDHLGRDMFARVIHGSRVTLTVGFVVVGIAGTIGIILGSIAGYYGGLADNVIMRVIDIILAVPNILLAIAIATALGPGLTNVMIAVGVGAIPIYARQIRAQMLTLKGQEFVEAAHAVGASNFRIIRRHILPNAMAPVIVDATMGMAGAILAAAGLSFLGIGLQAPIPEWGAMLADGRMFLLAGYWHMTLFPGLFISFIIFGLNLMGDGLRDALDPKLRSGGFSKKRFKRILRAKAEAAAKEGQ